MNDLFGEAMLPEDAFSEELGKTFCSELDHRRFQLDHFAEHVDDYQDCIVTIRLW